MSIITITHDPCSHGRETAVKIAERLDYELLGPEIINEVSRRLDQRSLDVEQGDYQKRESRVPSSRRNWYIAMFRAIFYDYMLRDNIVYHGLAGHVLLADVPNVLKVGLITDMEERVRVMVERNGITPREALEHLMEEDERKREWTDYMYGRSKQDPTLFNLYVNLHDISVDDAADFVVNANRIYAKDQTNQMKSRLTDLALEAKTESRLLEIFPEVDVLVRNGEVFARVEADPVQEAAIIRKTRAALADMDGIKSIHVGAQPPA